MKSHETDTSSPYQRYLTGDRPLGPTRTDDPCPVCGVQQFNGVCYNLECEEKPCIYTK